MKMMKIWLVMLAMGCAVGAWGQGWMKTYERSGLQVTTGIAPTADGGVLALAVGSPNLLKVDGDGNVLFEKNLDASGPSVIIPLPDGDFAIAGIDFKYIQDNIFNNDSIFIFLNKISPNGDIIWDKRKFISASPQEAAINSLVVAPNGEFRLAGFWGSGDPMGTIILKADQLGNLETLSTQAPGADNAAEDIIINSNGDYMILGFADSSLIGGNYRGPYLLKTNGAGTIIWGKTYENNTAHKSLINASNGGYLLAGDANQDVFVKNPMCQKLDDNGNEIWQKKWLDIKGTINDIIVAQGGGYYLYGHNFTGPYNN